MRDNKSINADSFVELQQENEGLGTGPLVWKVAFLAGQKNGMYVTIDSLTGDVLDIKRVGN